MEWFHFLPQNPNFFYKTGNCNYTRVCSKHWRFSIECNGPYFAKMYVYMSRSYTTKTSVIACLVFFENCSIVEATLSQTFTQNCTILKRVTLWLQFLLCSFTTSNLKWFHFISYLNIYNVLQPNQIAGNSIYYVIATSHLLILNHENVLLGGVLNDVCLFPAKWA